MLERKIIIGLITSTEFLQRIKATWDPLLIESSTAKRLASWCWEYSEIYSKAPGKNIEGIFFSKLKDGKIDKETADEIEQDILPGLSKEYSNEDFNLEYLVDQTFKYFKERRLLLLSENIQTLISRGELEEAEKMTLQFKESGGTTEDLEKFILNVGQIRRNKRIPPRMLIKPWLREGQITILYGNYGSGKSLLTITIAYLLGLREFDSDEAEINEWQVKHPTGTLYIDGELGEQEMEERISQFEWIGPQQGPYRTRILSIPEYQLATEDSFYLSERANQLKITHWLKKNPNYKLVVLDSASTLFGLKEENDNSEWSTKINPFLRDLRALDVACLLLHHAGKDGKRGLRGASAMGAMAHNIIKLTNHKDKNVEDGKACFIISLDKQRAAGFSFAKFALKFTQTDDKKETHWEVTSY